MNAFLMFKNNDFIMNQEMPVNKDTLMQDLEIDVLLNAMSQGNRFIKEVAEEAVFTGFKNDTDTILYRQEILKDCLKNPLIIRNLYRIVNEVLDSKKKSFFGVFTRYPSSILSSARTIMLRYMPKLKELKAVAEQHSEKFSSEGLSNFFSMINKELSNEYFSEVYEHLKELEFRSGVLISAQIGQGNEGDSYVLRKTNKKGLWNRSFLIGNRTYTFTVSSRDTAGIRCLNDLRNRGLNNVANSLAQSVNHIDSFFKNLKIELAFYIGCLNLNKELICIGVPFSFPFPENNSKHQFSFNGLYDISLALFKKQIVVGNDLISGNKILTIITGANQGGKSTFLRSVGLSQLMMQCGMYVPAQKYTADLCDSIFTHYKSAEDSTMESGKLDEELSRMNDILNNITKKSIILFNESFAATNEREGSEIAMQIIRALLKKKIKVFYVTHLYEFAMNCYKMRCNNILFLRASRKDDGTRTFKLNYGEPLQTSYGKDLYVETFKNDL